MNRTVGRGLKIMTLISENKNGLTLKEKTDAIDIPKSSAFDIIQTFLSEKIIEASKYNEKSIF